MKPFLPARYEHVAFGLLLSGMMSLLVSGFSTFLAIGPAGDFAATWMRAWLPSWAVAFPVVLLLAPLLRRILHRVVITGG